MDRTEKIAERVARELTADWDISHDIDDLVETVEAEMRNIATLNSSLKESIDMLDGRDREWDRQLKEGQEYLKMLSGVKKDLEKWSQKFEKLR